ncbi:MAG: hypothetical protein ACE5HO_13390 [bacterium]
MRLRLLRRFAKDPLQNPQKQAKVQAPEGKIDQMVYQLYGLSENGIKIVEGENPEGNLFQKGHLLLGLCG